MPGERGIVHVRGSRSTWSSFPHIPKPCSRCCKFKTFWSYARPAEDWVIPSNDNAQGGRGEWTCLRQGTRSPHVPLPYSQADAEISRTTGWFIGRQGMPDSYSACTWGRCQQGKLYARGGLGLPMVLFHALQQIQRAQALSIHRE